MAEPKAEYDIVVANILPGPLKMLATTLVALLRPNGLLAITGCQEHQWATLCDTYAAGGHPLAPVMREAAGGKWVLLASCG
eukprot:1230795-Prymnesium_polylepis.2